MQKMDIDTIKGIDKELLLDILTTAIDWSCHSSYWGQVHIFKWYWWYELDENGEPNFPMKINHKRVHDDTSLIQIRDDEDGKAEDKNRPWTDITLNKLADATLWALDEYNHLFTWTNQYGKIVDIDYDAIGADVILQKIVLGEVVYG